MITSAEAARSDGHINQARRQPNSTHGHGEDFEVPPDEGAECEAEEWKDGIRENASFVICKEFTVNCQKAAKLTPIKASKAPGHTKHVREQSVNDAGWLGETD
jgi:hypothetical protein